MTKGSVVATYSVIASGNHPSDCPAGILRETRNHMASLWLAQRAPRSALGITGQKTNGLKIKNPVQQAERGVLILILAMTYSHMGKPHTTIGDDTFHF
tara:strand:- start:304 stop:597 length:294 start_codon:yes stop_codon:yes gene_type:complete